MQLKTTTLLIFFSGVGKVVEKIVNNRIVNHRRKMWPFFLISRMILGLLDKMQIFWQLCQIELLGLLTGLAMLELQHLICPRLLTGFGMLFKRKSCSFRSYLGLYLLFSVIDSFGWLWMGSLHNNIQLILEFMKGLFFVLHFSYDTLTFLVILSVILLSMLMMLLSALSVIRHLICDSN